MSGMLAISTVAFFQVGPLATYMVKIANMLNPIMECMPELAMPTTNDIWEPDGSVIARAGAPYSAIWVTGNPIVLRMLYEISELRVATPAPAIETISVGGGVRSRRNVIGKARTLSVFVLNIIRMSPEVKMGRESMWYSSG